MAMPEERVPLIAHIVYSLGTGGLENGLVHLINRIPPDRYRHAVVCLTESGPFAQRIVRPGVEVISLGGGQGHDFRLYWKLWRVLRSLGPTIVHTRNLATLEAQIPAFFLPGVKTIHGVHGRDIFDLEGRNRRYNLLRKMLRPLVGRYITVSRDLRDWLIRAIGVPPGKVVQIYNGVDHERFAPGPVPARLAPAGFLPEGALVIGTVGRLAGVKDQASLLEAFQRLVSRHPAPLRLVIAGDGPLRPSLEAQARKLGIASQVWITGDRNDVPEILRLFDLFALPSLGEGISNTILEAMASGLPIVATRVGGNPELVTEGENGLLVPSGDPAALAAALARLLGDPALRVAMGKAGRQRIETTFSWNRAVAGYLAVYDRVLGGRPLPASEAGENSV